MIDGIMPCPRCGGDVTAWRMMASTGRFFEVDAFDPYRPHHCDPMLLATLRQAAAMERLADMTEERNALRETMVPVREHPIPPPLLAPPITYTGKRQHAPATDTPLVDEMDL